MDHIWTLPALICNIWFPLHSGPQIWTLPELICNLLLFCWICYALALICSRMHPCYLLWWCLPDSFCSIVFRTLLSFCSLVFRSSFEQWCVAFGVEIFEEVVLSLRVNGNGMKIIYFCFTEWCYLIFHAKTFSGFSARLHFQVQYVETSKTGWIFSSSLMQLWANNSSYMFYVVSLLWEYRLRHA